jgi:hypothetical protein
MTHATEHRAWTLGYLAGVLIGFCLGLAVAANW